VKTINKDRNRLNDIETSHEWIRHLHSVFDKDYGGRKFYKGYKTNGVAKPPELTKEFIAFFTKEGQTILDPFAGVGGILFGASMLPNRVAMGFDLYPEHKATYEQICQSKGIPPQQFRVGDAGVLLKEVEDVSVDLIFTDPPYGVTHRKEDPNSPFDMFGSDPRDLANCVTLESFYAALEDIVRECHRVLRPSRYMVLFLGDRYIKGHYVPVGYGAISYIERQGFMLKGVRNWWQKNALRNVFGFWTCFCPLIDHWPIFIYRRNK